MKKPRLILLTVFVFLLTVGGVYYGLFLPSKINNGYRSQINGSATQLKDSFGELERSTGLPLFADPDASSAAKQESAVRLKAAIADAKKDLGSLEKTAGSLEASPYLAFSKNYRKAKVLQEKTHWTISQSQAVIKEYENIINFLEPYNKIKDDFTERLAAFNSVPNLNVYAGRSKDIRALARATSDNKEQLQRLQAPPGLDQIKQETLKTLEQAEKGFQDLAVGLGAANDSRIYAAVRDIEEASLNNETTDNSVYRSSIENSLRIMNVQQITEKLDTLFLT